MATKIRFNENETHMWSAIRNAWLIVANIDRVPDMDRTEKERLKAEAKAMVAVYYAHMLRHYGGLPIMIKSFHPMKHRCLPGHFAADSRFYSKTVERSY